MKIHKKIGAIFGLVFLATVTFSILAPPQKIEAAPIGVDKTDIQKATFMWLNNATIEADFGAKGKVNFSPKAFVSSTIYTPPDGKFCVTNPQGAQFENSIQNFGNVAAPNYSLKLNAGPNDQNCEKVVRNNITINTYTPRPPPADAPGAAFTNESINKIKDADFAFKDDGTTIIFTFDGKPIEFTDSKVEDTDRNFQPPDESFCKGSNGVEFTDGDQGKNPLPITFEIAYYDISVATQPCEKKKLDFKISNPDNVATKILQWNDQNIQSLSGPLVLEEQVNGNGKTYIKAGTSPGDSCGGDWALVLDAPSSNSGTLYQDPGGSKKAAGLPNCGFKNSRSVVIDGKQGEVPTEQNPNGGPGGTTNTNSSDYKCFESGWALSWVACPVISAAQGLANSLYGFVEDQLQFTVKEGKQKDSLGGQDSREQVKGAWNSFRILVSGLVVILMLVMVIGQAIGSGPFDAYTVKKMLPRLVAGVILIQLSWPIFSFVINFVDALGRGLADIMYAPFGGSGKLSLSSIMGSFHPEAITFGWLAIPAIAVLGVVAPFLVLGLMLTVLVAIFAGFLTLLFRKILIILALILAPVALIAWMMPNEGLRRYWKLWWDNFLKALMMFPLIILIIAGGRIFAKIGSGQSDLVGFFIVLVGFFGPLFILPKTFKWGGTAMQAVGGRIAEAGQKGLKKPKEFLGERQKGYKEERRLRSKERVAAGEGYNRKRPWRYPVDKFLSGQWDPTLWGRRAERALATYKKTGRDAYTEDLGAARIGQQIDWEHLEEGGWIEDERGNKIGKRGTKDDYLQDVLENKRGRFVDEDGHEWEYIYETDDGRRLDPTGKSRMEKLAALYEMEKLGGATNNRHILGYWDKVSREAKQNPQAYSDFRRFMSDSVGTMLPKLTDIYKGTVSTADAGPSGVAGQHGSEIENMLATLTNRIRGSTGTERAGHIATLNTYLRSYLSAAKTDALRGGMEQGGKRIVKALVTTNGDVRDGILGNLERGIVNNTVHYDPEDGRANLDFDNPFILTDPDIVGSIDANVRAELDRIISGDGNFDEAAIKAGREAPGGGGAGGAPSGPGTTWRPTGGSSTPT